MVEAEDGRVKLLGARSGPDLRLPLQRTLAVAAEAMAFH